MLPKFSTILLAAVALFALSTLSEASMACFDWDCNSFTRVCTFDGSCSTTSSWVWKYRWDFGDGSEWVLGGAYQTHEYPAPPNCPAITVELTIIPWADDWASVSCPIIVKTCVGPALPTEGRCSG